MMQARDGQMRPGNGYTTGTCAAIAARAAVRMIFEQKAVPKEAVMTPKGVKVTAAIENPVFGKNGSECAVRKDAGDDPDVTDGALICVNVKLSESPGIRIDGGRGIGRVTKPGLSRKPGEAAINRVPRRMIAENMSGLFESFGYEGGADVLISVPGGEELAKKTFNPRLGIEGGISILGTSGIVEPMSEQAIIDTICVEMDVRKANEGDFLLLVPGNYGMDFLRDNFGIDLDKAVKCSNYVGEALDHAARIHAKGALLVGHIGKLIKLSGGIMNTHSRNADARMELIAANAVYETEDMGTLRDIMECVTTDEAVNVLKRAGICERVMERILRKALFYMEKRVQGNLEIGLVIFTNEQGILAKSENAGRLLGYIR